MAPPTSRYRWNAKSARYLDARGRFVSRAAVREEIDHALGSARQRMAGISESLRTGAIGLDDWYAEMRRAVKQVHLYSAAAAKGGWAQLTQADFGRVGSLVREQYRFLNRFAQQIVGTGDATGDAGGLPLDGRFLRRVSLYAEAGRATYHKTERAEMEVRQMDEERSVLNPADHCDECIQEAEKDWVPIGTLIPIGERTCQTGCRCTIEYRTAA